MLRGKVKEDWPLQLCTTCTSSDLKWNEIISKEIEQLLLAQVSHSPEIKWILKTIKLLNHTWDVCCHLFLVFGVLCLFFFLQPFQGFFSFLPLTTLGKRSKKNLERLQNDPVTEKRWQWTTKVWFGSFIFFKFHFNPGERVNCASGCLFANIRVF